MKMKTLLIVVALAFAAATNVKAAFNLYITTDPAIPGEVTMPVAWANAWEILSFSIGVSNPAQVGPGGITTSGQPSFSDLALQKLLDKASVAALLQVAQGGQLNSVTLSCVNTATNALVYQIKIEPVVFSSIQHSGSVGGDKPSESVTFTYAKITWTYYPPTGPAISHFYDLRTHTGG